MTKKELKALRNVGIEARCLYAYLAKKEHLTEKDKETMAKCEGVILTVYLISEKEWDQIFTFVRKHFPAKYESCNGNIYTIQTHLKADYFKEYGE